MITSWNVGGMNRTNGIELNARIAYDYELGVNKINKKYDAKIGLMYVSDYYYGALPTHWTKPGYDSTSGGETRDYRSAINDNWMHMGMWEWTISPYTNTTAHVFFVFTDGYMRDYDVHYNGAVRPTFNLVPSVELASGSGTKEDPYRIKN